MTVKSEILATTDQYFTLKLTCFQSAGSGAEWNYYYTIDLSTGKRLQLADLFQEGSDYLTTISDNIKQQMKEQMAADENKIYWARFRYAGMGFYLYHRQHFLLLESEQRGCGLLQRRRCCTDVHGLPGICYS